MNEPKQIRDIGLAQHLLIWAVLASLIVHGLASVIMMQDRGPGIVILLLIALVGVFAFSLYSVYRIARAEQYSIALSVFLMVLILIPLIGLICLLVLNQKATATLKQAGIHVGLMGAKTSDLPAAEGA